MARQLVTLVALLAVVGCPEPQPYQGAFDLPTAAAVLQPEVGGPFDEPIGFVANGHGGAIVQLALKQGRFLTDDPTVSFLRTNYLATGSARRLSSVAVRATAGDAVDVWAGDLAYGTLLYVPYILDCAAEPDRDECAGAVEGIPVEQGVRHEVVQSPDGIELADVSIRRGYTTTERFTITYDGAQWTVVGSRSGLQLPAQTGVEYSSYEREIGFTIRDPNGRAQAGDTFLVDTDAGVEEVDVGGGPLDLKMSRDGSLLAMIVADAVTGVPAVRWFDPVARTRTDVTLAADAWPTRLAWAEDGALLVTDRDHPAVWEVPLGDVVAIEHPTPWPTLDVASLDGEDRRRLYVVPVDGGSYWLLDRDTDELIDVNAAAPGVQGMEFTSTIMGIEAIPRKYETTEFSDDTLRVSDRTVAVTLSDQRIVWAHEQTGCLVQKNVGPTTVNATNSSRDYVGPTGYDPSDPSAPSLAVSSGSGRHVIVNGCAGIALGESWELRYDQNAQAWRVKGALSGEQVNLAFEDVRYLSDDAAVSFTIQSGALPTLDGSVMSFTVDSGIPNVIGDANGDGLSDFTIGLGADPVFFEYRVGLAGAIGEVVDEPGWYVEDIRPFTLVLGTASDLVGRVDPQQADIDVGWN